MLDLDHIQWSAVLERTCRERLVEPVFQPIVDVVRGVTCGYEGLSRFTDPDGPRNPEAWFTAALMHDRAGQLEALVLEQLLASRSALPPNTFLSLNVSPHAFVAPEVKDVLGHADDLGGILFEITEQAPVEDYERLTAELDALRERGALIAVDDTGAGYASLSHLLALRPEFVKLDRKLVSGLHEDPRKAAAVSAIGAFAAALDAWLIAEGVEERGELERLIELGVPLVQGYLLGRPERAMQSLPFGLARWIRDRSAGRRSGRLNALASPAATARSAPAALDDPVVLVDEFGRPQQICVPDGVGGVVVHPALTVLPHDELRSVALRAAARDAESRYAPVCLCDDLARLSGVIDVSSLLEALARGD